MTRKVLVTDYAWPSLEIERDILSEVDAELLVPQNGDEAELVSLAPLADAILTNWKKVPAAALDASRTALSCPAMEWASTTYLSNGPQSSEF